MKTLQDAIERLATVELVAPVAVSDVQDRGKERRRFAYRDPLGALCEVEIDADPAEEQLEALAESLPVTKARRAETLDKLLGSTTVGDPVVVPPAGDRTREKKPKT